MKPKVKKHCCEDWGPNNQPLHHTSRIPDLLTSTRKESKSFSKNPSTKKLPILENNEAILEVES